MYRLVAFIVAVIVLIGLVFTGGFLTFGKNSEPRIDHVAATIQDAEQAMQTKADQEVAEIDAKAALSLNLPELDKPLTTEDINLAVQKAGVDAEKTALRVGQTTDQAETAKRTAETIVRAHMERRMQTELAAKKSL